MFGMFYPMDASALTCLATPRRLLLTDTMTYHNKKSPHTGEVTTSVGQMQQKAFLFNVSADNKKIAEIAARGKEMEGQLALLGERVGTATDRQKQVERAAAEIQKELGQITARLSEIGQQRHSRLTPLPSRVSMSLRNEQRDGVN